MSLADEIGDVYEEIDAVQIVSIVIAGGSPIANVKALRRMVSYQDMAMGAALGLEPTVVPWSVWRANLAEAILKQGDRIVEANGTIWVIGSVDLASINTRFRCLCTQSR